MVAPPFPLLLHLSLSFLLYYCHYSPLQQLGAALIHRRILSPLGLAQTFIALLADGLAIETLLHIVAQVMRVVELRLYFEEPLQLVHHIDGIEAQLLPINDVQLLGRIVGQPVFQMLCILARIEAAVAQILQSAWRCIACSDDLRGERQKERERGGRLDRWQEHVLSLR